LNLTLVALYGPKPQALADLVLEIQSGLSDQLGDAFSPYTMEQIHATLVGLEGYRTEAGIMNSSLLETGGAPGPMDLDGLFRFLLNTPLLPLNIRIGGFRRHATYPLTSRGQHLYARSFVLRRREAVVIGWPVNNDKYPMSLDRLRRHCMDYNVLHKYHQGEADVDNDLFMVLGRLRCERISPEEYTSVESCMRELLSSRQPLDFTIGVKTLSVVAYDDRSLPTSLSRMYPLSAIQDKVDSLSRVYEQK
jgi:hypothetical protein